MVTPGASRNPPFPLGNATDKKHVTAIAAKTLALRVFIGQGANRVFDT